MVHHLVAYDLLAIESVLRLLELADIDIAHANVTDLSGCDQFLHRLHRAADRIGAAPPMEQINVEVVGLEPFQAYVAGAKSSFVRRVRRNDFADKKDVFSA